MDKKRYWSKMTAIIALAPALAMATVDDRGMTATQGPETWLRAAAQMAPRLKLVNGQWKLVHPKKVEIGHLMDPAAPQSPFSPQPWTLTPMDTFFFAQGGVTTDPNQAVAGHAGNSEIVCGELGAQGTQMDALGHFGVLSAPGGSVSYYGGLTQQDVVGTTGLKRLGIEKAEPIITTAVMLDAAKYLNNGNALPAGYAISSAEIQSMLASEGLSQRGIKDGDVVLIHTGYGDNWENNPSTYYLEGPGLSYEATVYLASKNIVLVGLDNPFTDAAAFVPGVGPFPPQASWADANGWLPFGTHHYNLTQAGIHQIQNMALGEMADENIYLSAIFILPIRFKGGAGSPVRPVVIGHSSN